MSRVIPGPIGGNVVNLKIIRIIINRLRRVCYLLAISAAEATTEWCGAVEE